MRLISRLFTRGPALPQPRPDTLGRFFLWLSGAPVDPRPIKTKQDQLSAYAGWAYSAVSTIAQDVRANPWVIWRKTGESREDWQRISDEEVSQVLKRPNNLQTWGDFIELSQLHLDLTGEAFWHVIDAGRGSKVLGIETIYPHWVDDPIQDEAGRIVAWPVTVPGRTRRILPADDVIFVRYPHPLDPLRGASPVEAYAVTHDLDIYARAYGSSLLKNRAVPELAISSEQDLTPEQADVIREHWIDRYRDPRNGPAVFGRGAKVQQLGLGIKDLAFLDLTSASRDLILSIYKVPAAKVGLTTDFNRANAEAADATYKENCILPRLRRIEEVINLFVMPRLYGAQANSLWFEFESPVDEDREFELRRSNDMLNGGTITVNQYRERLGDDPIPGGDVFMVPLGKRIVSALTPDPDAGPDDLDQERLIGRIKEIVDGRALAARQRALPAPRSRSRRMPQANALMELGELRFLRAQDGLERRMRAALRALFSREQRALIAALKQQGDLRGANPFPVQTRDWVDEALRQFEDEWRSVLGQFIMRGYREGWLLVAAEVEDSLSFDVFREEAERIARRIAGDKIRDISDTTLGGVREIIADGIAEGKSIDAMARDLAGLYDGFKGARAEMIARTETVGAVNGGKEAHASEIEQRLGLRLLKTWVATDDDRTRESHVDANGQTVRRSEPFELAGGDLMHPGDPSGPPEEIINCRCTVVYEEDDAEE